MKHTFNKGDKVTINEGAPIYQAMTHMVWPDHSSINPNRLFIITGHHNDGVWLAAKGYGDKTFYGKGQVFVNEHHLTLKEKVK